MIKKSEIEEQQIEHKSINQQDTTNVQDMPELLANLRLSIKTVEVMGLIIYTRYGSLDLKRLEYIYEQGLKVHLRILTSFIEIIKDEKAEQDIVDLLKERVNQIIDESRRKSI